MVKTTKQAAGEEPQFLKRAQSAYFFYLADNRAKFEKELGTKKGPDVAKHAGAQWKELDAKKKEKYEKMAEADKERYEKEKASGMEAAPRKTKRGADDDGTGKKKAKKEKDPNAPKRAQNAYMFFTAAVRPEYLAKHNNSIGEAGKAMGNAWKEMSDSDKAPFQKKADADKKRYDREIAKYQNGGKSPSRKSTPGSPRSPRSPKA